MSEYETRFYSLVPMFLKEIVEQLEEQNKLLKEANELKKIEIGNYGEKIFDETASE